MEKSGIPVPTTAKKMLEAWHEAAQNTVPHMPDFENTRTAFSLKSDEALEKAARLFGLMNHHWLVGVGSMLGLAAIRLRLPFVEQVVKYTIFEQFCAGTTLLDSMQNIQKLHSASVFSALDYGVEAKETEEDFNHTMNEIIRAIEFADQCPGIRFICVKLTGLTRFSLLEAIQSNESLNNKERNEYRSALKRIDAVCHAAAQKGISVFIDAEESWIQNTIDHLATLMMARYNRERAVVYNTFQMYRTDRLPFLLRSFDRAVKEGYILGAKLVRGAYMEKERERAAEMGYPSPIHPSKEATDHAYDTADPMARKNIQRVVKRGFLFVINRQIAHQSGDEAYEYAFADVHESCSRGDGHQAHHRADASAHRRDLAADQRIEHHPGDECGSRCHVGGAERQYSQPA